MINLDEKRFRSFVENANDLVYALTPEGIFTYVSPNWVDFMGVSAKDTIGTSFEPYVHPDDLKLCQDFLKKVITSGKKQSTVEYRVKDASGNWHWHMSNGSPLHDSEGKVTEYLGIARDITEAKQKALIESEERFRVIFEKAPAGIALVGMDYQLIAANKAYCDLLGYTEEEIRQLKLQDFTHSDDLEENMRLQNALGRGDIPEFRMEKRFIRKNGEIRWGYLTACSLHDSLGKEIGFLGHVLDITESKKLQERLRQMEKMDAIGHLAGGIAHDFNNQLSGILGYADLLRERIHDPRLKQYLENICSSAMHSADLTRKLLAFSRKGQLQYQLVDVHQIIQETVEMLIHSIDKRIRIQQKFQAKRSTVNGDQAQLQNALLNLAINARDAMPEGGILCFSSSVVENSSSLIKEAEIKTTPLICISVSDTGYGISPEVKPHLFEPFFTTKEQGKGTGMGLASVYGTIKQHQGFIQVDSELKKGSEFKLYLPLADQEIHHNKQSEDFDSQEKKLHILLVDDEQMLRELVNDMLSPLGHKIITAVDGQDAVSLYRRKWKDIDLVILDMVMPRMNGRDCFKKMKILNPQIKAFIASGYTLNEETQQALSEGVKGFLNKPFKKTELLKIIQQVMNEE